MAHIGKNLHRLKDNLLEQEFAVAWQKANDGPYGTLAMLMGDSNRAGETSERDELVAATAIQWIGSPVGQGFLRGVLETPAGNLFLENFSRDKDSDPSSDIGGGYQTRR